MATFYNFAEPFVRRAIPDAWSFSTPERVLQARYELAELTTRRLFGDVGEAAVGEVADLVETAARAARPEGRPLFAAHASLPWPQEPHQRLWHAATLLREHRGDGHVALLVSYGIDGLEGHVLAAAAGTVIRETQQKNRGWSTEQWQAAIERLSHRGFVDPAGAATDEGRAFKEQLERRTDELAVQPYEALGDAGCERLAGLLDELSNEPGVPYPNPMALPPAS